ncbi:hypothetical protein BHM03_00038474, partial [Ensete ventricosum]
IRLRSTDEVREYEAQRRQDRLLVRPECPQVESHRGFPGRFHEILTSPVFSRSTCFDTKRCMFFDIFCSWRTPLACWLLEFAVSIGVLLMEGSKLVSLMQRNSTPTQTRMTLMQKGSSRKFSGHIRLTLDIRCICPFQVLKDEDKRRLYDQVSASLQENGRKTASGGPFDAGYAEDEFSMNDVCRLPSVIFLSAVNALV